MGTWAEFEEKEFETLANAAFVTDQIMAHRQVQVFSPGQVLEKTLGFDFATHLPPGSRVHRRLFGAAPGRPAALGVSRAQLSANQIPATSTTRYLDLFLQYKRPEAFAADQHRFGELWPTDEGFLRFTVSEQNLVGGGHHFAQVTAMHTLAQNLGPSAVVRYACPSVWLTTDLYGQFSSGTLLKECVYVSPEALADPALLSGYHRRWTFQPEDLELGMPNPAGSPTRSDRFETLLDQVIDAAPEAPDAASYAERSVRAKDRIGGVDEEIKARTDRTRWRDRLRAEQEDRAIDRELSGIPTGEVDPIRAAVESAIVARNLGLRWLKLAVG